MTERTAKQFCGVMLLTLAVTLFCLLFVCNSAKGATWTFTIPASEINDTYINGYPTSRGVNYDNTSTLQLGYSTGDRSTIIGSPYISDSLANHNGTLDSFKIVLKYGVRFSDFIDGDSVKVTMNALKVIPITTEATDSCYAYGYPWQTLGAYGATDQYTPVESDGVHGDSVIVKYATVVAGDSLTLWGKPAHASQEWWIVRGTVMAVSADARFYLWATEKTTTSLKPYMVFYGTVSAPPVTYTAKTIVGVKK